MPDPISHALLGAACVPQHPFWGAGLGMLPDVKEVLNTPYCLYKYKKLPLGKNWDIGPKWLERVGVWMHSIFPVSALLFAAVFLAPSVAPLVLAYLSHLLIDPVMHKETPFLNPFVDSISFAENWNTTWKKSAAMIGGFGLIVFLQHI